jgi:hypothetical protein
LTPAAETTVLTCPSITAPVGSIVEITAMVVFIDNGSLDATKLVRVNLYQDGIFQITSDSVAPGVPVGDGTFDLRISIPLVWELDGDGLPHVYTVTIDAPAGGSDTQLAGTRAIFVNAIEP